MYDFLSESQKKAVDYFDGNLLVTAGAGSGKTRVIVEKTKKALNYLKRGEKILAITFSNKAADELRERLELDIEKSILDESLFIGTIHNFCLEIVKSRGIAIGLPQELTIFESNDDRLKIFQQAINNIPAFYEKYIKNSDNKEKRVKELFDLLSKAKRNLKFSEDYNEKEETYLLFKEYDELLLSQNAIDFDDILRYAYKILSTIPSITKMYQNIYKYIFIDEAQDLNKANYEIIKLLHNNDNKIVMVGDINQSIYGFNGSSYEYFSVLFPKEFNAKTITLNENYRSSKKVVNIAKKFEPSFQIEGVCHYDGEFEINNFKNEDEEADYVINKIESLLCTGHKDIENNKITLEQCIIIGRNRYVFNSIIQKLDEKNIQYNLKLSNNNSFTSESTTLKIFENGLRVIANSKDRIHLEYINNIIGINFQTIEDIMKYDFSKCDNVPIKCIMPVIQESWKKIYEIDNNYFDIMPIFVYLENNLNTLQLNEQELNLIFNDLNTLKELWSIYVYKSSLPNRNLINFIQSISLGETKVYNNKGLTLSTVHMSKGLEYDVVFIVGLNDGIFPDYRAINDEKTLLEEKHNMFVAITRSKRLLYLSYYLYKNTKFGIKKQTVSRFISMIK